MAIRLNKYIADCTGISRRNADALITEQAVLVNQKPALLGQTINPDKDNITLHGKRLLPQKKLYVIFYKPAGYLTSRSDPGGRRTIYDLLPEKYHHLDPVGRLDRDSSGFLMLTNDGFLLQTLTHPRYEHEKQYRVRVNKSLTPQVLEKLQAGVLLEPEHKKAVSQVTSVEDLTTVTLTLKTGMNRQIRRTFMALGYEVTSLKRLAMAGMTLGKLRPRETRLLKPTEVSRLLQRLQPKRKKPGAKKEKA